MATPHRLRADAARNRANILRAARALFAQHGEAAGIDEIAREAGVAVGTLYRHFPAKADLVHAVATEMTQRILSAVSETVARIDAGGGALAELTRLTERILVASGEDRAVKVAMRSLGVIGVRAPRTARERAMADLARIVEAGHADGSLHPDVTVTDLILTMETLPGDELSEDSRRRWARLMMRGLAGPSAGSPTHR